MKKHLLLAVAALSLIVAVAACGSTEGDSSSSAENTSPSTNTRSETKSASDTSSEGAVVRVITPSPVTAGTWDPSQYAAYSALAKENGWELQVAEAIPYGEASQVLNQWGEEKVDVVFSTDNGFEEYLLAAAEQYPETAFVMMSALASTKGLPNVAAYNFDWCEFGYVQGAAAAVISKDHTIGDVGSINILPVTQTLAGQEAGAAAVEPGTKILHKNSGDFTDSQKAATIAAGLIGEGADTVVALVQGAVSPQIASRAQSEGAYYVGSFGNEEKFAPKATVTSTVINFGQGYEQAVDGWMEGNFSPEIHTTGFKAGTIEQTPLTHGFEKDQSKLDEQIKKVEAGEVQWPSGGACAKG
ncbi:MAG TPA: BMP family ABC transporter substrate-binding protein [Solirubrobacterales bacterium]